MIVERTLHHFPLDPFSRQARLALGEKRLPFREVIERYWERPESLNTLNPSGLTPVLVEMRGGEKLVLCESRALLEHLEEQYPEPGLLGHSAAERAEARRLVQWFDRKFDYEVNGLLLHEKMEKRLLGLGSPDPGALRAGREALKTHLGYMESLLDGRDWLAGERLSLADIAAAGHLSVIDYMGEIPWDQVPAVRLWYAKIKSRPCFRPLLGDRQPGLPPSAHYHDLDF
ncbi:MAG: glutathione S-transferase [Caulobacterales bacterium 32-69-10]|nr:MAG: glutathione S-transferase [Caulobacterales bacterium 32-69-10]